MMRERTAVIPGWSMKRCMTGLSWCGWWMQRRRSRTSSSLIPAGIGWIDVDPTNNLFPSMRHITLGWGRDYDDVIPPQTPPGEFALPKPSARPIEH